jgi:hypothetical protein
MRRVSPWFVAAVLLLAGSVAHGRPVAHPAAHPAALPAAFADDAALEVIRGRLDPALGEADRERTVQLFLSGRWQLRDGTVVDLVAGVPWDGRATTSTTQLRLMHSLLIVHDLVEGGPEGIEAALGLVGSWEAANPRGAAAHHMAWHDETTARRTSALVRLHDALCDGNGRDEDGTRRAWVQTLLEQHLALLLDDGFHATGTNHGMFQDRAALVATAYLTVRSGGSEERQMAWSTARDRLVEYYRTTVRAEGVHLEHAPAYHQVIAAAAQRDGEFLAAFGDHGAARILTGAYLTMDRYATHVVQPDGTWPLVSDTFPAQGPDRSLWDDPGYRYAASGGEEGLPPAERAVAFPESGYVIMRDRWTSDGEATYLHFTAAYHSDYHKHADDLSVWLYHDGPLLTELGPQGYAMDDPLVQCAYSAAAHNVVSVEGVGAPARRRSDRTEPDRRRRPRLGGLDRDRRQRAARWHLHRAPGDLRPGSGGPRGDRPCPDAAASFVAAAVAPRSLGHRRRPRARRRPHPRAARPGARTSDLQLRFAVRPHDPRSGRGLLRRPPVRRGRTQAHHHAGAPDGPGASHRAGVPLRAPVNQHGWRTAIPVGRSHV